MCSCCLASHIRCKPEAKTEDGVAAGVRPPRGKAEQLRRTKWSLQMALKSHRALTGSTDEPPSPPASTTVRAQPRAHRASSPSPRSSRRAVTPLAIEHNRPRSTRCRFRHRRARSMPCTGRSPRSTRRGCRHRRAHSIKAQAGRIHGTAGSPSFRTPAAPRTVVAHA